jgi:ParB-like chromosome segregation protein Spo0J
MKIEIKKVSELIPYFNNTKEHTPDQIKKIAKSIEVNGFLQPLIIDKYNVVIAGHGRLLAAQKLGMLELPCVVYEKTKSKARALRMADNKLNESNWFMDLVREEINEIDEDDLQYTFFEDYILNPDDDIAEVEDEESAESSKYVIKFEYEDSELYSELLEQLESKAKDSGITKAELLRLWITQD